MVWSFGCMHLFLILSTKTVFTAVCTVCTLGIDFANITIDASFGATGCVLTSSTESRKDKSEKGAKKGGGKVSTSTFET